MRARNGERTTIRIPYLDLRSIDPRRARLARFDDAASAEDDYFRFANRGR